MLANVSRPRPASVKAASHMPRRAGYRRLVKQLEAEGLSYRKIAAELAARGHVTSGGKPHVASAIQKMRPADASHTRRNCRTTRTPLRSTRSSRAPKPGRVSIGSAPDTAGSEPGNQVETAMLGETLDREPLALLTMHADNRRPEPDFACHRLNLFCAVFLQKRRNRAPSRPLF